METRTRIKYGDFEIEGSETLITESFITERLPEIVKSLAAALRPNGVAQKASDTNSALPASTGRVIPELNITTSNIAAKLDVKTAVGLVIAAATHLHFVKGKHLFTRSELLDEMKSATSYFNESMRKNMSRTLAVSIKDNQLNERTKDTYALTSSAITTLQQKLN